jgi:site-specific recombinase XerD
MGANSFKKHLLGKGQSKESAERNYKNLCYYLVWCEKQNMEPESTDHNDLIYYLKYLQKRGVKQITAQKYIGSLKHYFGWLLDREVITSNPANQIDVKGVQRKQLHYILKKQELESLYEAYKIPSGESEHNQQNWFQASEAAARRNKVVLGLMIWQGLGTTELSRLEQKDVKLREGKIFIAGSRRSNEREMKLESTQILDLMEYMLQTRKTLLEITSKDTDRLIVSTGKGHNIHNLMTKLMQKLKGLNAGVKSVKQIRTSVITHWLKNHNLREVQYMAGHRYVSSTEAYLVNDLDDLLEDVNKYHPI